MTDRLFSSLRYSLVATTDHLPRQHQRPIFFVDAEIELSFGFTFKLVVDLVDTGQSAAANQCALNHVQLARLFCITAHFCVL